MSRSRWVLFMLVVSALVLSSVLPALAQDAPAADGLRPDAPEYAKHGPFWVGYKSLVIGEDTDRPIEAGIWYPAMNPNGDPEEITYEITLKIPLEGFEDPAPVTGRALLDAEIDDSAAPYPLVIFSPGFSTNAAWYAHLIEHYASHGFIVLAPEHMEHFDPEWSEIWSASIDRPLDVKQTLDYAEVLTGADGDMAGLIDMENVAVVGHSYGGYTALAMAGAQYDLEGFNARCAALAPDDPNAFLCAPVVPKEADMAARAGLDPMPEGLWPSVGDPRVKAIVPMAGDSYLFDKAGLAKITIPMMAIGGTADTGTPYDWGSKPAYDYTASAKKALVTLNGAEHTITTSCESMPWMAETPFYEWICFDPVWDKDRGMDLINHFSTAFLLDTLKGDPAAAAALAPQAVSFQGIDYQAEGYGPAVAGADAAMPVAKRAALAAVNGITLYYEVMGEGEPLLLLPGGTMCTDGWGEQREALARKYMVISPDSRAQGRSTDSGEPLTYQLMADDMIALMDRLGVESAHVVGWSDGGDTGLDLAIRYPERVRSLVATGAQFRADGMIPEELERTNELSVDSFPQDWLDFCYRSVAPDPEKLPDMMAQLKHLWLAEEYVPFDGLAEITAPVLILEGTVPDFLTEEHVTDLAAAIPGAKLQWIEGTGHMAPLEKAGEWTAGVLDFLADIDAQGETQ